MTLTRTCLGSTMLLLLVACDGQGDTHLRDASVSGDGGGPDGETQFVDVAQQAGLVYTQAPKGTRFGCDASASECAFRAVHLTGGAAAGDYDGDGWVDLYVTRLEEPGILYRNLGDGRFEDVTAVEGLAFGPGGNGAAWGDIDNDRDLDLYVTSMLDRRHYLFVNQGDGFTEEAEVRGAAVPSEYRHQGFSVAFGDYDRDGFLDIHTTEWTRDTVEDMGSEVPSHARLLRNRGAAEPGHYDDVTESAGVDLLAGDRPSRFSFTSTFADMDRDGWPDLLVVSDFTTSRLFWNQGDGTFVDGTEAAGVGLESNGMGLAVGDVDADGLPDWFVSSIFDPDYLCGDEEFCAWGTSGNRLYTNNGDRTFADVTDAAGVRDGYWGWGAAFLDYDNDGDLDLVMTNGVDYPNREAQRFRDDPMLFWRNDRSSPMVESARELGLGVRDDGRGLLVLDHDRDGDQDLFVVNHEGSPRLFKNRGGNELGFLRIELVGSDSNSFGVGAQVTIQAALDSQPQYQEILAGSHYLGQSEAVAHFGLGDQRDRPVEIVEVLWPSGKRTELRRVPRNRTLRVVER